MMPLWQQNRPFIVSYTIGMQQVDIVVETNVEPKIANAIKNLVDIGRNGTQTPYTAGISTSKVGALKSDGEYYTQEFTTNCGANTRSYIITATNGMPSGAKITNMNMKKQTLCGNSNFKVKNTKNFNECWHRYIIYNTS